MDKISKVDDGTLYSPLLQKKLDANNNTGASINENACTFFSALIVVVLIA
jgi:hypothetical protein